MAGALSGTAYSKVGSELRDLETKGPDAHFVVVYVGTTTGDRSVREYTDAAFDRWMGVHNGHPVDVALFVFKNDHTARIVTDERAAPAPALTDEQRSDIVARDVAPSLKTGDVDQAVENGVAAILAGLAKNDAATDAAMDAADARQKKYSFLFAIGHGIGAFFNAIGYAMWWTMRASNVLLRFIISLMIVGFAALVLLGLFGDAISRMRGGKRQ